MGAEDQENYMSVMLKWAKDVDELAKGNIQQAQEKQKKRYDAKHKLPVFKVGDKVWRYNSRKETRKGGKLEYNWDGPYTISEQTTRGTYRLKNKGGKVLKKAVSSIRLKACVETEDVIKQVHVMYIT